MITFSAKRNTGKRSEPSVAWGKNDKILVCDYSRSSSRKWTAELYLQPVRDTIFAPRGCRLRKPWLWSNSSYKLHSVPILICLISLRLAYYKPIMPIPMLFSFPRLLSRLTLLAESLFKNWPDRPGVRRLIVSRRFLTEWSFCISVSLFMTFPFFVPPRQTVPRNTRMITSI